MKTLQALVFVVATFLLAACGPSQIYIKDGDVSAESHYPSYVKEIRTRTNDSGMLEVQIVFLTTTWSKTIEYRVDWLDAQGHILRNPVDERYQTLRLVRNEEVVVNKLASDIRAKDIKIQIK